MWWKEHKWKVIVPALVLAVLAGAFWYGGGAPGLQGWTVEKDAFAQITQTDSEASPSITLESPANDDPRVSPSNIPSASPSNDPNVSPDTTAPGTPDNNKGDKSSSKPEEMPAEGLESRPGGVEQGELSAQEKEALAESLAGEASSRPAGNKEYSESQGMVIDPATGKDQYLTDPVPEGKPLPVEPQDVTISDVAYTCTISISCATILDHMDWLDPEKAELVPEDGWILEPMQVTFYEGESVFNVLQRTCKQQNIHMEFENTPMYNSAYIEGLHNLYEFDCGELSGWMYKVNEWFPNYGCSRYQLQDGDVICWEYTCDLGIDVGGYRATGG